MSYLCSVPSPRGYMKASIILPTHKDPGTISYSIKSVLNQNYKNYELIIVLDGADESTKHKLGELSLVDKRIKLQEYPKGVGRGHGNRDLAIKSSSGDVIFFIDEDDLWLENHLNLMLEELKTSNAHATSSVIASITPKNKIEIAISDHATGILRDSISKYINVYDTHFCILKKTYLELKSPFFSAENNSGGPRNFFKEIALSRNINWVHIPEISALSFHGGPRRSSGISDSEKTHQIQEWYEKIIRKKIDSHILFTNSSVIGHLAGLIHAFPPCLEESLDNYLKRLSGKENGFITYSKLTTQQLKLAQVTFYWYSYLFNPMAADKSLGRITERQFSKIVESLSQPLTGIAPIDDHQVKLWREIFGKRFKSNGIIRKYF